MGCRICDENSFFLRAIKTEDVQSLAFVQVETQHLVDAMDRPVQADGNSNYHSLQPVMSRKVSQNTSTLELDGLQRQKAALDCTPVIYEQQSEPTLITGSTEEMGKYHLFFLNTQTSLSASLLL